MAEINSVCVYCGSSSNTRASHRQAAAKFGTLLAAEGVSLIFGGGRVGLMGLAADATLNSGGRVIGVIPEFLAVREVAHTKCTELHTTVTMHERKQQMADLSDAFVILPGGLGTLDEMFEIITWRQLNLHQKPIIIANIDGYWDPLEKLMENMSSESYISRDHNNLITFVSCIAEVLPILRAMPSISSHIEGE
jgi:uncharacterized protein (TIGR00730 family)